MKEITKILSEYIYSLKSEELPDELDEQIRIYIADYFASSFAGYKTNKKFNKAISELLFNQGGRAESSVFPGDVKLPSENAAYLNAAYAHGADMDDGNKKSMGHIAAHTMSSVFALAEKNKAVWQDIFISLIAGYEAFNRIAGAAQPGIVKRGFHSTGITGSIASAAACSKLMSLDERQIYNAMSIAALQAGGLLIITESGQNCKPLNAANAARLGIISAKLAGRGIEAPYHPLESKKGWFHAMTDTYNEKILLDGLGKKFTISESYLKPYASCRHTHYGIECAIDIRRKMKEIYGDFDESTVKKIKMRIYPTAVKVSGIVAVPENDEQTKFSLHYALAISLLTGNFGFDKLKKEAVTKDVIRTIDKIEIIPDTEMENVEKGERKCTVEILTVDDKVFETTVATPKGDPENPLSWDDMTMKLKECSSGMINDEKAEKVILSIKNAEKDSLFSYIIKS